MLSQLTKPSNQCQPAATCNDLPSLYSLLFASSKVNTAAMTDLKNYFLELRSSLEELHLYKNKNIQSDNFSYEERRNKVLLLFVLIKKCNRTVKYNIKERRIALHSAKLLVESNRLHLQNLLYEVNHLNREIRHCHNFKSQDEDIHLLTEEEYKYLAHVDDAPLGSHEKRLCLLEWELMYRKQLAEQSLSLLNSKKEIFQAIVSKVERMTSISPSLQSLLEATHPLQKSLETPLSRRWRLGQLVNLLPPPLYLAYVNCFAIDEIMSINTNITIIGSEKDIYEIELQAQQKNIRKYGFPIYETETISGKTDMSILNIGDNVEKLNVLIPHPLVVKISVGETVPDTCHLFIRMFPKLGFCSAAIEFAQNSNDGSLNDMIFPDDILQHLFPDDTGDEIPNIIYQLSENAISQGELMEYLLKNNFGRPYRWVNRVCGIQVSKIEADTSKSVKNLIIAVVIKLKRTLKSCNILKQQVRSLMEKDYELNLSDEKLPFSKPTCSFLQWTPISWEEYSAKSLTKQFVAMKLVEKNNIFFRAVIVRGSAKMECLISISRDFPYVSPLWIMFVYWNGEHNATTCSAIKMMEYLTNSISYGDLENEMALLSFQLVRTMFSFDIFLETEGPSYVPQEYSKENNYIKAFAKRCRSRPYRYVTKGSCSVFKH